MSRNEKSTKLLRQIRRMINRKFGGWKKFVLIVICICILIYCLTSFFSQQTSQLFDYQIWEGSYDGWNLTNKCGVKCKSGQLGFYIRTGDGNQFGPTICYEGQIYISHELNNYGRGLNIVVIDDKTHKVTAIRTFDTYTDEAPLIRFLKKTVPDNNIIMVASFDDSSYSLKEDGKKWMQMYGSSLISRLDYRESFLMIGQRGLLKGSAIEFKVKKYNNIFADYVEKAGCFDIPLGKQKDVELFLPDVINKKDLEVGEVLLNCGHPLTCEKGTFPVRVDTGHADKISGQICFNGHIMMSDALNKGGRGFNILIIDPVDHKPSDTLHVDTYTSDSTDLEVFLESLITGDIVIAYTRDEASRKLSHPVKELLNRLGSGHIQNLKYRDVWYFVGQKGLNGFTTFEEISYAGIDGEWPKSIQKSFCLPKKLIGQQIIPDHTIHRNDLRRAFCKQYKGYFELCDPAHVDDVIKPVKILSQQMETNKIYSTPIVVIPGNSTGLNHNALVRTLQTILMQPGINPSFVTLYWDEKFPEYSELADLFGFKNQSLSGSLIYSDQIVKAIYSALSTYSKKDYFIIIEEDLLLSSDYLYFMSQCVEVLGMDESLAGVSAWNINGYEELSGNISLMYRVEEFPGLGSLMKRSALEKLLDSQNINTCCKKRVWYGWDIQPKKDWEILVPDVSRVYKQMVQGADNIDIYVQSVLNRPRTANLISSVQLNSINKLTKTFYEDIIIEDVKNSAVILLSEIVKCYKHGQDISLFNTTTPGVPIAVYYKQQYSGDYLTLTKLVKCLGFYATEESLPRNLHKGLFRYYFMKRNIYLVGSETLYYPYLPQDKLAHIGNQRR